MNLSKLLLLFALLGFLTVTSCKKDDKGTDDDDPVTLPENVFKIADNIYSYAGPSEYYSMFIVTTDGVIAIEPINTTHSEGFLEAIQEVTDQPVKFLLHSHDHWDHSSGGQVFKDVGATSISHIEAFKSMTAHPGPDMAVPDESWEGCQSDITLGETTLEMHYLGLNHGLGMTIFLVPDEKVAYIADLVTPNRMLFNIVPDFNIPEWERSLEEIMLMDFDKAVYSHNERENGVEGGDKQDVADNLQLIRDIRAAIFAEFQNGTPGGAIPTTVQLPQYQDYVGYDDWLPMNVWRLLLDMGMGTFPIANVDPCVAGGIGAPSPSPSAGTLSGEVLEIADNIYSYRGDSEYYSMFVVTTDGVIAIESINSPHSRGLLEAIQSVTSQPVRYMLHSHDHWDHSSGGQVFKDAGAITMAHKEAFDAMTARPGPDMSPPDESWDGCENSITLGGTTVEMRYLGMNHGLGMTVFLVPDKQVAYIADLVTPNRMLFNVVPDFNIPEWERSLERIMDMPFTKAVYSHNERANGIEGGDKQDVADNLQLIRDIRAAIFTEFQNGTPGGQIPNTVQLPQYQDYVGYEEWLPMNVWRLLLDQGMGPFPWRDVPCGD